MNTKDLTALSKIALDAVRIGCAISSSVQQRIVRTASSIAKQDRSPVTIADYAVQVAISRHLASHQPNIPMMAEEDASQLASRENAELRRSIIDLLEDSGLHFTDSELLETLSRCNFPGGRDGRFWVLDPIDGTKGFLRGDQYAIALALIDSGRPVLGVLGCPKLSSHSLDAAGAGSLLHAVRGQGSFATDLDSGERRAIRVSNTSVPADAILCRSYESAHSSFGSTAEIASNLGISSPALGIDSQAKYGTLALGFASIYLRLPRNTEYREKIWDHAAGVLVVQEAGGRITDVSGADLDFGEGPLLDRNGGIVVTNGHLHDAVLDATRRVLSDS